MGEGTPPRNPSRETSSLDAAPARAAPRDQLFVEGLRQRRLFRLIEAYCAQRLADENLSDVERAELVDLRIRNDAEHAVHSAPEDRPPLWRRAREAAAQFAQRYADNPRLLLVRFQDALTVLAQGELLRQEAELGASAEGALAPARESIRQATRLLVQLDKQLSEEIPRRSRAALREGELSSDELFALQHHVRRQLARAYRNQALCYAQDSNDRAASLTQAMQQLEKPLSRLPADDPLAWEIRVDQIVCHRLLGEWSSARRVFAALEGSPAPPPLQLRARAEAVRIEMAAGDVQKALDLLSRRRETGAVESAELDFAGLETYLALWRRAEDSADPAAAKRWRDQSVAAVRSIEQTHGAYWARRAELALVNSAPKRSGQGDLEVVARSADRLYLQGLFKEAVEAYERAGRLAKQDGDASRAFELLYKAALVEQKRGGRSQFIGRLRALAASFPSHPQACASHMLAIKTALDMARSDAQAIALYEELLQEHLANWPRAASADTVRMWMGRLHESRGALSSAIAQYQDVGFESDQFEAATEAAARCWLARLDQLKAAGEGYQAAAESAGRRFEQLVLRCKKDNPTVMRQAAVTAARIRLNHTAGGCEAAERTLLAALQASPDAPRAWKTLPQCLLVVALSGQPHRQSDAHALLKQMEAGSPQAVLEMLVGLSAVAETADPRVRAELAKRQLEVADLLRPHQQVLDEQARRAIERIRAAALAASGRRTQALAAYAALARAYPRDGRIQQQYADLLLSGEDRTELEEALRQWRLAAQRSRPRSERWYRAKYSIALAQLKLGDKKAAAELIAYVEAAAGFDSAERKRQFDELRQRCIAPQTKE